MGADRATSRGRSRIPILMYHSVDTSDSVVSTPPSAFAAQMRFLHESGVQTLSLSAAVEALRRGPVPARAAVITFDDGFESVYKDAFPVLVKYGISATVFLVTGYCGRDNSWPSQPGHITRRPLLTWGQVTEMHHAGICFGAHTHTHPHLTSLSRCRAEDEILTSKQTIEDHLQQPVQAFAYPYGAYDDEIKRVAAAHFAVACSTRLAFARPGSDMLALERLDVHYLRRPLTFRRLFSAEMRVYLGLRRAVRELRAWALLKAGRPGPVRREGY
jgi:peptidoglycan/xylan/chitin deacetylase (PgdA/CDA1 family)